MSTRPPYSVPNNSLPPLFNHPVSTNSSPVRTMNQNSTVIPNNFVSGIHSMIKPRQDLLPDSHFYNNDFSSTQQCVNKVPFPCPSSVNGVPDRMPISASLPTRFSAPSNQYYPPQPVKHTTVENCSMNPVSNQFGRNADNICFNRYPTGFAYSDQNVGYNNTPRFINFQGYQNRCPIQNTPGSNVAETFNPYPQNVLTMNRNTNTVTMHENSIAGNINSSIFSGNTANSPALQFASLNSVQLFSPQMQSNCSFRVPPPLLKNYTSVSNVMLNTLMCNREVKFCEFLNKFSHKEEKTRTQITVPEFRSLLKAAFTLIKLLTQSKSKLTNLMEAGESEWNSEIERLSSLKEQLSEICSLVTSPVHLSTVIKKLKFIKKKRELKKKTKLNQLSQKIKMEQNRKELNQEIDKYLDDIKEKNLKLKREAEMKKEADYILLEVRKKIHEANRTIEKIKVFEKLRNARQTNAVQKGLHIVSDHNEKFEKKVSSLKETMLKQLADYEAEEKALKVMLETEQEGQLEEEAQWKLKKVKTIQQKKQNNIKECLFGNSEDPLPTDPLFLFHKYHISANSSIENLAQIRHHWDVHIAEDGEVVPQQWVVPVAANSSFWEQCLINSVASRNPQSV